MLFLVFALGSDESNSHGAGVDALVGVAVGADQGSGDSATDMFS